MYITHKISFKLLDKYNLCGIIKNVENRWIDDSSRFHSFGNKPILIRLLPIDGLVLFIVICYVNNCINNLANASNTSKYKIYNFHSINPPTDKSARVRTDFPL